MAKKIYVGNLPFSSTEDDVRQLFEQYGAVESVNIVSDRDTGRPRGFAFVEISDDGADAAVEALNQQEFGGRNLRVDLAKPREPRRGGGGAGNRW